MKRRFLYLGLILTLISCSTETYEFVSTDSKTPVAFSGKIQTRVTGDNWDENDEIGIFMIETGQDLSQETIVDDAFNRKYIYQSTETENGFFPDAEIDKMYYPQKGAVDFIAYYPFGNIENYGIQLNTYNQISQQDLDLLYSNNLTEIEATTEVQPLQFKHQLVKLLFNIIPGNGITKNDLSGLSLTFKEVKTQGFFSLNDGSIALNDIVTQDVQGLATSTDEGLQVEAILIPQDCSEKKIQVQLSAGNTYIFSLGENSEWKTGNKYLYEITLSSNTTEATLKSEITPWIENDEGRLEENESYFEIIPWDGSIDTDWYSVEKTEMTISRASELAGLAYLVNTGTDFTGKTIQQKQDLDLNNLKWTPIGQNDENPFTGSFQGNGFNIKNVNPVPAKDTENGTILFAGLFGVSHGDIGHVIVYGDYFIHNTTANILNFGGICGKNDGSISYCRNYAPIISSFNIIGNVTTGPYVGGITGLNNGNITECENYADLSANNLGINTYSYLHLGGITGGNTGTITYCENVQNLTGGGGQVRMGGIAGLSSKDNAAIEHCTNQGKVTMNTSHTEASAGGIVGKNSAGAAIRHSTNRGEVTAAQAEGIKLFAGGIAAYNNGGLIKACENRADVTAVGMVSANSAVAAGGICGYNISYETYASTIHQSTNFAFVSATGSVYNYAGGIAGFNKTAITPEAKVFSCNENLGKPVVWIGNATSAEGDLIDRTEHSEE